MNAPRKDLCHTGGSLDERFEFEQLSQIPSKEGNAKIHLALFVSILTVVLQMLQLVLPARRDAVTVIVIQKSD
jgi:hypothetical protein